LDLLSIDVLFILVLNLGFC